MSAPPDNSLLSPRSALVILIAMVVGGALDPAPRRSGARASAAPAAPPPIRKGGHPDRGERNALLISLVLLDVEMRKVCGAQTDQF